MPADQILCTFPSIPTAVDGLRLSQGLEHIARVMDRATLVRSLTSPYNIHNVAYALSGVPTTDGASGRR